jgi:hypothetical protein
MDKLTPENLRDMAALNDAYDHLMQSGKHQTRGGFLREEAARREGEAGELCDVCGVSKGAVHIAALHFPNLGDGDDSAATPPAADAQDDADEPKEDTLPAALRERVAELDAALFAVVNDPSAAQLASATITGAWAALANRSAK